MSESERLPEWAAKVLGENGTGAIEAAIAAAEKKTSGEIVPMLVERSSSTGHVPALAFSLIMLLVFILDAPGHQASLFEAGWLSASPLWLAIDFVLSGIATAGLARLAFIQRVLTPEPDRVRQVDLRAQVEFFEHGLEKTAGDTGVLLFISLMEHRAVVLADKAIASKLDPDIWQEVVDLIIEGIRSKDLSEGLAKAIERCGDLLAPHFPVAPDDKNELRNRLVVME